ncbi:WG repeat-containing protein [Reichenbachiella versicolor]|uniref:WG repeat-containing protein n=1 Tax=Reichenbachiella versicolor TaxID=1821036 RepID=UPI000D6E9FA2|nr:WG repeat-containing protein [Reichenbachiella versicolor]
MKLLQTILISSLVLLTSCKKYVKQETTNYQYYDVKEVDLSNIEKLLAVTKEGYLQYGIDVAYINSAGDTILPFGQYAYFGTDTLEYYATVMEHPNDSTYGRQVGINRDGKILFDLVLYDMGPDYFNEGLTRVKRNGKMGFVNKKGEIIIPCQYDFAGYFENGSAEVTFEAREYYDLDDHLNVESDSWFCIDRKGNIQHCKTN